MGMRKSLFIGLISCCFLIESKAQLSLEEIPQKYSAYQIMWSRVKLQLVLNQDKYTPGDTVFFKAYLLNEDLTQVAGKQLVDVNLVDSKGKSIVQLKFNVKDGYGHNQLIIPNTLSAGMFYITAHNNRMKNFDPAWIFKKKVAIVRKNEVQEQEQAFLYIAAEGGHLISNVPNKIGAYTNREGATVQIIDDARQEVARFATDGNGTGSVIFKPSSSVRYTARIMDDTIETVLPVTDRDGVALQLTAGNRDVPNKIVLTSAISSVYQGKELYLVITARGKIQFTAAVEHIYRDSLEVKTVDLPAGLAKVSVLETSGKVLASRDFYNDRDQVVVAIQSDQPLYHTRDRIKLDISITDHEGKPVEGEFSVRALHTDLFKDERSTTFRDELLLSDVTLPYTINRTHEHWQSSLDNFLITAREEMPWATILSGRLTVPSFLFTNVIEKKGTVYFADTDTPLPDLTQVVFYMQHNRQFIQTFTTDHGRVGFSIPAFYGDDEFFYMAQLLNDDHITDVKVIWDDDSFPLPASPEAREQGSTDLYAAFMERKRLIDESFGVYRHLHDVISNEIEDTLDDWEADIAINVEDYVPFSTMQEMIREVVPAMYSRQTKRGDIVRVKLQTAIVATTGPLYIIHGIATRNTALFLSLKPSDIRTLKVLNSMNTLKNTGLLGKYGIVIVETRKNNFREPLNIDSKVVKGNSMPVELKMYNLPASNISVPDFRSTLYWNPSVKTNANGKATVEFFNSDDVGKFRFFIDGLTTGGEPFSYSTPVDVQIRNSGN